MNPLKKLAGQTAIYGVSSIVGRIINFLLVPLYTNVLNPDEYGLLILMYSFVAVIYVFLIYGMETTYFRYSELETDRNKVYNTSMISIGFTTIVFVVLALVFSSELAAWIRSDSYTNYVQWFILIMGLDALAAIPFARLRAENRPIRFASIKLTNIGITLGLNLFFILFCPFVLKTYQDGLLFNLVKFIFDPKLGLVAYVFISNLIASFITLLLLTPELIKLSFDFDKALWKKMITYAYPLLLIGFAFSMNEMFGRILMNYLLPEEIAFQEIGIYSASYKLAILLSLFVQAFRYAAEPFFFAQEKEKNSKQIYATVMKYFILLMLTASLGILLYIDVIKLILGREFRGAIQVLPILLSAYIFIGVFYNLSVWYKLTNKTLYGSVLALIGMLVTIVLNFILIPEYGYLGSAWATLACYFSMMMVSYFWGRKHFQVNYDLKKIALFILLASLIYFVSTTIYTESLFAQLSINTLLIILFFTSAFYIDRKEVLKIIRR